MRHTSIPYSIAEIVPHSGTISLLDKAIEGDQETMVAEAIIQHDNLFYDTANAGVGAWVGIEYMAQTVAAWAGWQSRLSGSIPRIGYLLGTRRYQCKCSVFRVGDVLRIKVQKQFQADNGLGQFDCSIYVAGEEVATAALTVFEPASGESPLKGK